MSEELVLALALPACFMLAGLVGLRLGTPLTVAAGLLLLGGCHVLALAASAWSAHDSSWLGDVLHPASQALFAVGFTSLLWIASVFPAGRRPPRGVLAAGATAVLAPVLAAISGPTPVVFQATGAEAVTRGPVVSLLPEGVAQLAPLGLLLAAASPVVFGVRYHRADGEDRQMMRWPVVGTAVVATALLGGVLLGPALPAATDVAFLVVAPVLPMTLALGPVRRRLLVLTDQTSRLSDDLAARVGELEESRRRLSTATEEERRRVERDLHDGAQQELLALLSHLEIARESTDDPTRHAEALSRAAELGHAAFETIRRTAHGVRPAVLDDLGLAAAVRDVAGRSAVPALVRVDGDDRRRYPAAVEGAALMLVTEALANVHKHAGAAQVRITLVAGPELAVDVVDDGCGGLDPTGRGIQGLCDRAESVGGRLEITSRPGHTRLHATFPGTAP